MGANVYMPMPEGFVGSPEYKSWNRLIHRCYNPKVQNYHNYGGRGIKVCDRWRFGEDGKHPAACFFEDMGPKPTLEHTIDSIDGNGN